MIQLRHYWSTPRKKIPDEVAVFSRSSTCCVLFLGYDTTAQTLAYAGYELARNPEIQKRLQDEVDAAYEDANGEEPDYSVIQVGHIY